MSNVWILGAGFSASLGGPLLKTLFSQHSLHRVRTAYPEDTYPAIHNPVVTQAHWLYQWGRDFAGGRYPDFYPNDFSMEAGGVLRKEPGSGMRVWENAEEFLEYLSLAPSSEGAQWRNLIYAAFDKQFPKPGIEDLHREARRLLAAECMLFTEFANPESERWKPYVRWATRLVGPGDIIISFNYDPVLEKLAEHLASEVAGRIKRLMPGAPEALRKQMAESPTSAFWLKLHGSTDWLKSGDDVVQDNNKGVLKEPCAEPCMGIPGPGKADFIASLLSGLWAVAMDAIGTRYNVYFLGYRFPPTDAQARTDILHAMRSRHPHGGHRTTKIILGRQPSDGEAVAALVREVRTNREDVVEVLPFGVEDALTVLPART